MAHQYFNEELSDFRVGDVLELYGSEAHHAATVSRLRSGEIIRIGNGRGLIAEAEILRSDKNSFKARAITVHEFSTSVPELILVQALAKTDRDERAIETATELGVDRIIPWAASRSISKWDSSKAEKGEAKWGSIVKEASKQSLRARIPTIESHSTTDQVIQLLKGSQLIVLDPPAKSLLSDVQLDTSSIGIVVGPEGGITDTERDLFASAGAHLCSMGTNILRTSTAGPAAIAIIGSRLGRC